MTESMAANEHKRRAPRRVVYGILVVSTRSSRGEREDASGPLIRRSLEAAGHEVSGLEVVPDEAEAIRAAIARFSGAGVEAIVATGGTGLAPSDVTVETVRPLFVRELTSFATLFAQLSYDAVGSAALLSRATAGILEGRLVLFALPGSPAAVTLALDRLVLPETGHILKHLRDS